MSTIAHEIPDSRGRPTVLAVRELAGVRASARTMDEALSVTWDVTRLAQRPWQPNVAFRGVTPFAFTGRLLVARAEPSPDARCSADGNCD